MTFFLWFIKGYRFPEDFQETVLLKRLTRGADCTVMKTKKRGFFLYTTPSKKLPAKLPSCTESQSNDKMQNWCPVLTQEAVG